MQLTPGVMSNIGSQLSFEFLGIARYILFCETRFDFLDFFGYCRRKDLEKSQGMTVGTSSILPDLFKYSFQEP